ncbi:hypothetical protein HYPSUDRAFT_334977 [Hypholoma sublateritium FD-334 SS-4]|uniref:Uncharacterized protein n=1 Tax=Hypholoma sublateritium (strain FD-334 SS-4) TaxID=945553 RepID=A0A0D2KMM0_HYPSF|nr:hypothetical protein HYPSUDRAFT_334977 [Hypholoma sublateritium FD-334 SS-4]
MIPRSAREMRSNPDASGRDPASGGCASHNTLPRPATGNRRRACGMATTTATTTNTHPRHRPALTSLRPPNNRHTTRLPTLGQPERGAPAIGPGPKRARVIKRQLSLQTHHASQ